MAVPDHPKEPILRSLSARLLLLTIAFVMLGEVLIYAPSVARFRKNYLEERVASAHLATLALESLQNETVGSDLQSQLLKHTGTYNIVLRLPTQSVFVLGPDKLPGVDISFDLREPVFFGWIRDAYDTLMQRGNRVIRVIGPSPKDKNVLVEVMLDEKPMRLAMLDFSWRILGLSIVISVLTAGLVFLSLQWLMVRPMRRITRSMMSFRANPENQAADELATTRGDEIGVAQRELGVMQNELRQALRQRRRLAALGAAVAKINHDLRNSLTTAMLVSDRLTGSEDPEVKRLLPKLFTAIDKAVDLCTQTLDFASEGSPQLAPSCFSLRDLLAEVKEAVELSDLSGSGVRWRNNIDRSMQIEADREQLFRAINNIGRNAVQAGASKIEVNVRRQFGRICIDVSDNGPGVPEQARDNLFTPFLGSTKKDGTGLGLVIVRDIMKAHGGDLILVKSDDDGVTFCLDLPEKIKEGAHLSV